jgi:hypothetical protein
MIFVFLAILNDMLAAGFPGFPNPTVNAIFDLHIIAWRGIDLGGGVVGRSDACEGVSTRSSSRSMYLGGSVVRVLSERSFESRSMLSRTARNQGLPSLEEETLARAAG